MKFIHASDLHLDSPFEGIRQLPNMVWEQVHSSPLIALAKLVDVAIENQVDFVLLVGDLYDQDTQSISTQLLLKDHLQRLVDNNIAVYLSYGNHDYHLDGNATIGIPEDVVQFGPEVSTETLMTSDQKRVAISGFSYNQRWIEENKIPNFPERKIVDYHIGMLHGSVKHNKKNDHYAPFELRELVTKHYDYWALGHIHKSQQLVETPPIVYPGTIQGRNKNESGPHGFELVSDETGNLKPKFIPVSPINWVTETINADQTDDDSTLIDRVMSQIDKHKENYFQLILLVINNIEDLTTDLFQRLIDGTWQRQLDHEQQQNIKKINGWIYEVTPVPTTPKIEYSKLDKRFWETAREEVFTTSNIKLSAGKLMQIPFLSAHFADLDVQKGIINRAENLLVKESRLEVSEHEN